MVAQLAEVAHKSADKPMTILMVDDDVVDQEILQRAVARAQLPYQLVFADNGKEGLKIMRGENRDAQLSEPYVVLLDLNMPVLDGFGVLEEMRKDPKLKEKVVFVMSTSDDEGDVSRAYSYGISGYIQKSDISEGFDPATELLAKYRNTVILP